MGGVFGGGGYNNPVSQAAAKVAEAGKINEEPKPGVTQATQEQEKEGSKMRGARRRGRQLLSDARLSGEMGMETLGGGSNLG